MFLQYDFIIYNVSADFRILFVMCNLKAEGYLPW